MEPAPDPSEDVESGWASIARTIQEVDVQKIQDYKEDIDTLLVFVSHTIFACLLRHSKSSPDTLGRLIFRSPLCTAC